MTFSPPVNSTALSWSLPWESSARLLLLDKLRHLLSSVTVAMLPTPHWSDRGPLLYEAWGALIQAHLHSLPCHTTPRHATPRPSKAGSRSRFWQFICLPISPQRPHLSHGELLTLSPTQYTPQWHHALCTLLSLSRMPTPPTHSLSVGQRLLFRKRRAKTITSVKSPLTWFRLRILVLKFKWSYAEKT